MIYVVFLVLQLVVYQWLVLDSGVQVLVGGVIYDVLFFGMLLFIYVFLGLEKVWDIFDQLVLVVEYEFIVLVVMD